jgi:Autoinducer binding domain
MTRVAWSQTQRRNAPLPFVLVGAGGSRQFVSIPVHAPNGVWAFLIATSNESDAEWEVRRDKLMRDLKHIAHHMYRRMAAMLMIEDQIDFSAITRRETEALKLASLGKSGGVESWVNLESAEPGSPIYWFRGDFGCGGKRGARSKVPGPDALLILFLEAMTSRRRGVMVAAIEPPELAVDTPINGNMRRFERPL